MPKRNYEGDSLDGSWKTPPWQNEGETVDGSSEDDHGEHSISWMPDHVDEDALTPLEKDILYSIILPPDKPLAQIARDLDCSRHTVGTVNRELLKRERPDTSYRGPVADSYDDLTPKRQRVIDEWAKDRDATISELADRSGSSYPTARSVVKQHEDILQERLEDD